MVQDVYFSLHTVSFRWAHQDLCYAAGLYLRNLSTPTVDTLQQKLKYVKVIQYFVCLIDLI